MSIMTTIQAEAFLYAVFLFFAGEFSIIVQLGFRSGKGWTRGLTGLRNFWGNRFGLRVWDGVQNRCWCQGCLMQTRKSVLMQDLGFLVMTKNFYV